ncbi:MAG: tRNA 2-thiouridine(34) synthase MnmA, partial [Patescibacteria group bacterium]
MEDLRGKRVFVGLSGGVDSAVSAALLQQAGADAIGVFIKGWYPPGMPCTWSEDRADAMRAAAHLRIPFYTFDASREYKQGVIDYLLREYAAGRTPNPDIMCNREVKFGAFWRFAKQNGADFIATGHYAQQSGGVLSRGVDAAKDQSYFLWAVPKKAIQDTLFPVGGMPKERTRELAIQFGIPQAAKRDSQGICFLGSISVDDFLRSEIGATSGMAIDEQGKEVGTHEGAVLATLGERVAITGTQPGPWYVVKKDMDTNVLTVSHAPSMAVGATSITIAETNWLQAVAPNEPVVAQYRYHGPRIAGTLSSDHG